MLKIDPQELYFLSIRTGRKLPDDLHNSMLLWSFDDKMSGIVKEYLEWADHCQHRDELENKLRERMRKIDQNERLVSLVALVSMFFIAAILTLK